MKVILVNGSPHPHGCTFTALEVVAAALNEDSIETQFFHVGTKPLSGCIACQTCAKTGRCVFSDGVNDFLELAQQADGFIFGSPVHFFSIGLFLAHFVWEIVRSA
ncbi:NADPH-dependent FMN reductase [Syntrophus gentianae]|uniref:NADPH-dependent FMN reductase n=1 Tax=Syntrophus gentianae TaxID=43775 RepID=A0A1H7W663_9BACT|nr:flavodoxin family protein [Syntrophus gentianae]SEM16478.1 NADPH-dependent FMN reductase [Syntrophus gentianae]